MRLQTSAARRAPVSALALLALLSPGVGAQCAGQTYALNAPSAAACAPCAPGATFVSQTASCAPSPVHDTEDGVPKAAAAAEKSGARAASAAAAASEAAAAAEVDAGRGARRGARTRPPTPASSAR